MRARRGRGWLVASALVASASWAAPASAVEPPGASSCAGCHGRPSSLIPSLQGHTAEAIAAALREFRSGARPATLMNRIAKGFSDAESEAIAAWIAAPR